MKEIRMQHSEHQESPNDTQRITCLGFPVSECECRPLIKPKLSKSCNYANEPYSPHLLIDPPWGQNISFFFCSVAFLNYNSWDVRFTLLVSPNGGDIWLNSYRRKVDLETMLCTEADRAERYFSVSSKNNEGEFNESCHETDHISPQNQKKEITLFLA